VEVTRKISNRQEYLLKKLLQVKQMTVEEVSNDLSVSLPTARRLCTKMANENLVIRTHGGIRIPPAIQPAYSFEQMQNENMREKTLIAEYAASKLIKNGQTIFLEAGTTVLQLAIALAHRIENEDLRNLTIYTNSLNNFETLKAVHPLNLIGGEYRPARRDFSGFISERIIRSLRFDMCFVGTDAISVDDGIMAYDESTVQFDELLINRSSSSIVLAQSSKFDRHSHISYAKISDVSAIITDGGLNSDRFRKYNEISGNIIRVPEI